MTASRWLLVVVGATWAAGAGAGCDGGGNGSDAGTGGGGPIVIQATERIAGESLDTCGGCHVIVDQVRAGDAFDDIVPDVQLYVDHQQMLLGHDLELP